MTCIDQFELNGRVALVMGAGLGIGRQCTKMLANAGATVVLASDARSFMTGSTIEVDSGHLYASL